jgi:predicted nuclease with TOPRIM domain
MEHQTQMSEQVRRKLKAAMQENARIIAENARLKAEVESIRKYWKATGEGVNRYVGKSIALEDEVARLKAEVERLTKQNALATPRHLIASQDIKTLREQVERLTSDLQMEKENEDRLVREWQRANNEVYGLQTQVAALIDELERLKKKQS